MSAVQDTLVLPTAGRGRRSAATEARYQEKLDAFYAAIMEIGSRLEFRVSSRGWCYILENAGAITKGAFGRVERLINDGRKKGKLPLGICSEDTAREFDGLERLDNTTPEARAADLLSCNGVIT